MKIGRIEIKLHKSKKVKKKDKMEILVKHLCDRDEEIHEKLNESIVEIVKLKESRELRLQGMEKRFDYNFNRIDKLEEAVDNLTKILAKLTK